MLTAAASSLPAQSSCSVAPVSQHGPSKAWPAPLDRVVSLRGGMLALREALDRLAAVSRVRLSYSSEALPLDRRVCATYSDTPMGRILYDLLDGVSVQPTILSANQVVLVPQTAPQPERVTRRVGELPVGVLDRIVVTGSAAGSEQRALAVNVDVVGGDRLAQRGDGSLAHVMNGEVPGMWSWEPAPSAMALRYGSIRGASSFGVNAPKIYIDGIEVANPLLVTQVMPETIERVEIIRGPQGAALYGADAISGVVNIITRHDGLGTSPSRLQMRSTFGMAGSAWAPTSVLAQDLGVAFRAGTNVRGGGASVAYRSLGAFLPEAFSHDLMANADFRKVGSRSTLIGTARLFTRDAGTSSPLLRDLVMTGPPAGGMGMSHDVATRTGTIGVPGSTPSFDADSGIAQKVREYTLGVTGRFAPNEKWTHTLVAGVDGFALTGDATQSALLLSATDSALHDARGETARATLRASSVGQFTWGPHISHALTFALEQTITRQETAAQEFVYVPRTTPGRDSLLHVRAIDWRRTSGAVAQLNSALGRTLYLTAGLRFEGSGGQFGESRLDALPMLGLAAVKEAGPMSFKLRTAYGKGIRVPQLSTRERALFALGRLALPYELPPETQSGIEFGFDASLARLLSFHVTRFDQRATGLLQIVGIAPTTTDGAPTNQFRARPSYALQNVGSIANKGWEMSLQASRGPLVLGSALSLTDSRVLRLADGYMGDLRPGDRTLEVPARTLSLSASWNEPHWYATFGVSRASDWVNYDRLSLAQAFANGGADDHPMGGALRDYWLNYAGVTRVRVSFSRDVFRSLSLLATGDNLLNYQRGEPDNITIVPGRTISAGLRVRF
ncbi:MAG: TonB-dependent receptor [Gemmatimonadaceae bacterium]